MLLACNPKCLQIGMPHRGRLNVLCNLLQKPAGLLFSEMQQSISDFHVGDVQYHQGTSSEILVEDLVRLFLYSHAVRKTNFFHPLAIVVCLQISSH